MAPKFEALNTVESQSDRPEELTEADIIDISGVFERVSGSLFELSKGFDEQTSERLDSIEQSSSLLEQVGNSFEQQYEIAALTLLLADGSVDATYILQPPVEKIKNSTDRAGSPTISLDKVKKAIVSKEPIKIVADSKGEDIKPGPKLDVITNQPVSLNINIQGPLRVSDYIRQVAEERGVMPEQQKP